MCRFVFEEDEEEDSAADVYTPELGIELQAWLKSREEKMAARKRDRVLKAFLWKMKKLSDQRRDQDDDAYFSEE